MLSVCPRKEANASNGLPPRTVEVSTACQFFDSILAQDAWHDSFHSLAEHNAAVLKSTRVPWQGTQEIKGA